MDLNIRTKSVKCLEENLGKLYDIGFCSHFLDMMTPKAQETKRKNRYTGLYED